VLDLTGRVMMKESIVAAEGTNMRELDLSRLARGIYLVRLESGESGTELIRGTVE